MQQIEHIKEDNEGNFWIGTDKGLSMMTHDQDPLEGAELITFFHNDFDPGSLLTDAIKALFIDSKGRCWIGSYFGGVNFYDKYDKKFFPIRKKVWKPESSLSHNNVTAFTKDNKGNLWIGTDGGGLNMLPDADKNLFTDRYIHLYTNLSGFQQSKPSAVICSSFSLSSWFYMISWSLFHCFSSLRTPSPIRRVRR